MITFLNESDQSPEKVVFAKSVIEDGYFNIYVSTNNENWTLLGYIDKNTGILELDCLPEEYRNLLSVNMYDDMIEVHR